MMHEPQLQWVLVTSMGPGDTSIHLVHAGVGILKKLSAPSFLFPMVFLGLRDGFFLILAVYQ